MNKRKHSNCPQLFFECEICNLQFMKLESLNEHKRIHQPVYFKCDICVSKFYRIQDLEQHKQIHSLEDEQLKQHKQTYLDQPDDPKMCNICYKLFDLAEELKVHTLIHLEETPYKCNKCGESFTFIGQLKDHKKKEYQPSESEISEILNIL